MIEMVSSKFDIKKCIFKGKICKLHFIQMIMIFNGFTDSKETHWFSIKIKGTLIQQQARTKKEEKTEAEKSLS